MEKEYIITFSSFYKAAYAQDVLREAGIDSSVKRLPSELAKSCGTGLYVRTGHMSEAEECLERRDIASRGIYEIKRRRNNGREERIFVKVG